MTMKINFHFDTQREREFINGLGTFAERQTLTRKELLQNYLKAAKKRCHWHNIDPFLVIDHAKNRLKEIG